MAMAMLMISMFACLVAANAQSNTGAPMAKPAFCRRYGCPSFQLLSETEEYEVRLYQNSSWVSTDMLGVDYQQAKRPMFMSLFSYIKRGNDQQKMIPMTIPVLKKITPIEGNTCDITMSFFNDPEQGPVPAPTNPDLYVHEMDNVVAYVRRFGGFADYSEYKKQAQQLTAALKKDGLEGTFTPGTFITTGYSSPWKKVNRHNEVWIMKTQ